jgi:hypothetical protein
MVAHKILCKRFRRSACILAVASGAASGRKVKSRRGGRRIGTRRRIASIVFSVRLLDEHSRALATGAPRSYLTAMVKILISPAAFAAIAETLPLGTVAVEPGRAPDGSVGLWVDHATLAKLHRARGPGESYSDAIVALAAATADLP